MKRYLAISLFLATVLDPQARAAEARRPPDLTAEQIARKNVEARGGLEAWRAVQTLKMTGELGAGGKTETSLPFALYLQRGHRSRLEITFAGKNAVQVYDGTQGWKLRPFLNRDDVEPFRADELETAASASELDGLLVDHAARGTRIELVGVVKLDGKYAYELAVTLANGKPRHLWVDATTFLETKVSGDPRKLDGKVHQVAVYSRDYRSVSGLKIPFVQETVVEGVGKGHKMVVKEVAVNPALPDSLFTKPTAAMASAPPR